MVQELQVILACDLISEEFHMVNPFKDMQNLMFFYRAAHGIAKC